MAEIMKHATTSICNYPRPRQQSGMELRCNNKDILCAGGFNWLLPQSGCLESVEWNGGMEHWNGILESII